MVSFLLLEGGEQTIDVFGFLVAAPWLELFLLLLLLSLLSTVPFVGGFDGKAHVEFAGRGDSLEKVGPQCLVCRPSLGRIQSEQIVDEMNCTPIWMRQALPQEISQEPCRMLAVGGHGSSAFLVNVRPRIHFPTTGPTDQLELVSFLFAWKEDSATKQFRQDATHAP